MYEDLKEEITKIHNFVNTEFDIEDNNEIEAVKATLSLSKIEMLDNMLNDYKKSVNKLKRAEQNRKAQESFKQVGTNLRIEEFEIYKNLASAENISISQYVKNALNRYKNVSNDTNIADNELLTLKPDYEALKGKYEALETELLELKQDLKNKVESIEELTEAKAKIVEELSDMKTEKDNKAKELQDILVDNSNIEDLKKSKKLLETDIELKDEEIKNLKSLTVFDNLKSKFLSFFKSN